MEKILNTQSLIEDQKVIVTTEVERTYDREALRIELDVIQRQKERLVQENLRILQEYDDFVAQQEKFEGYLAGLESASEAPVVTPIE